MIFGSPDGTPGLDLQPAVVPTGRALPVDTTTGLTVSLSREPFLDWFTITLSNGHTEELEADETREWFRARGANMDLVEKALDHTWNFCHCQITIAKPRRVPLSDPSIQPDIGDLTDTGS